MATHSPRINTSKLVLLPVPSGYRISYRHITDPAKIQSDLRTGLKAKRVCYATLRQVNGNDTREYKGVSRCSPRDTDNKAFARIVAHNRCIKSFHKIRISSYGET